MSHCSIFARPVKQWHVDRTEREREREREREGGRGREQRGRRAAREEGSESQAPSQARGGSNMDFSSLPPNPWDFGSSAEKSLAHVKIRVRVRPQDRGNPNIDLLLPTG